MVQQQNTGKKGYYFMVDALIALFVLTLGVVGILAFHYRAPQQQPLAILSQDFMDVLSGTQLSDINDPFIGPTGMFGANGNITHFDNTVLQQIAEFYYRLQSQPGCTHCLNLINTTIHRAVPVEKKYNYLVSINDDILFSNNRTSLGQARIVLPARKIVHGEFEDAIYGPYLVEVLVWE